MDEGIVDEVSVTQPLPPVDADCVARGCFQEVVPSPVGELIDGYIEAGDFHERVRPIRTDP